MTYGDFGFVLLLTSGASLVLMLCCLIGAVAFRSNRTRLAFATALLGALSVGSYWLSWTILAGI